jgi:methylenetetrahydrofolate dehydrogenase (NADP+) / methenyltetrahydrofolate cyclohydrolase
MTHIFNGKEFADRKLTKLENKVDSLIKKGIRPNLVSILVGNNRASKLYVGLKEKVGKKIGIDVTPVYLSQKTDKSGIIAKIQKFNIDKKINGIMLQLPLPNNFNSDDKDEIIGNILSSKDVDGLRIDSPFIHPTSRAVLEVLDLALNKVNPQVSGITYKVCVVGSSGMVGRPLVKILKNLGYEVVEADGGIKNLKSVTSEADILISCCGVPGIIKKDMIKVGVVLIDVGAPVGDVEKEAYNKASFTSPVPGGIGPVTISCLLENVINTIERNYI